MCPSIRASIGREQIIVSYLANRFISKQFNINIEAL